MKEEYIKLLKETKREGIEKLIEFLENSDFFEAPASTRYHGAFKGGLLEHSMKVYEILKTKTENTDSVKIIALLHDICKVNYYKTDYRNVKNNGIWEQVPYYTVEDNIPYGHGEKSVMMITEFIKLTSEEKYAIRWHMGFTEPKELYTSLGQAYKKYPIALYAHEADLEATYLYDI
ncbi:MAG: HD domain-containing protein [Clostridia bacterium]|nr:HD domain-containing protein [Clostridia bacterium]